MLFEEIVLNILKYCPRNISLFLVNKTFERLYDQIIYNNECVNKLYQISYYEQDYDVYNKLKKFKKDKLSNYWLTENRIRKQQINVYWSKLKELKFNHIGELFRYSRDQGRIMFCDRYVNSNHTKFGYQLIKYFMCISDDFEIVDDENFMYSWKYKHYSIIYDEKYYNNEEHHEYIFLMDMKFNNYLAVGYKDTRPNIACNKLVYTDSYRSKTGLEIKDMNPKSVLEETFKTYEKFVNLHKNKN
jgi:hypothetical protein